MTPRHLDGDAEFYGKVAHKHRRLKQFAQVEIGAEGELAYIGDQPRLGSVSRRFIEEKNNCAGLLGTWRPF
jgi:hypothetical protein